MASTPSDIVAPARPASRTATIQSVGVAARILRVLSHADGPLPLGEVARRADVSASLAHRYLQSLLREQLAYQDPVSNRYDLGAGALTLGLAALRRIDILDVASDAMRIFISDTGFSGGIAVWTERGPTIVRWWRGAGFPITTVSLGDIFPMRQSAIGLVFDAHLDPSLTAPLAPGNDPEREARKAKTRADGGAYLVGHLMPDIGGVACPILDAQNEIACTVTCVFNNQPDTSPETILAELSRTARQISSHVGAAGTGDALNTA